MSRPLPPTSPRPTTARPSSAHPQRPTPLPSSRSRRTPLRQSTTMTSNSSSSLSSSSAAAPAVGLPPPYARRILPLSSMPSSTTATAVALTPPPPPPPTAKSTTDPILRNALRYTITPGEYASLHRYVLSRSRVLKRHAPSVTTVERIAGAAAGAGDADTPAATLRGPSDDSGASLPAPGSPPADDDYNSRAVRHALRVFVVGMLGMRGWDIIERRLFGGDGLPPKPPRHRSATFRLPLSLSFVLLLYRLLFRFFTRLRAHLLASSAEPFRRRNPRTAAALTSPYAPGTGAALAGFLLGIFPASKLRVGVALWAAFRALEWTWDVLEREGRVWGWRTVRAAPGPGKEVAVAKKERPWWFGSWMLQPFVFGQLLHAVVFDRDCFPADLGNVIFGKVPVYLHRRPKDFPQHLKWPRTWDVVDDLARMAKLNWPGYISPTMFPDHKQTLPASITSVRPLTSSAHPLIKSLSCATLHPSDPSCLRTYLAFWLRSFPPLTRLLLLAYAVGSFLPALHKLYHAPFRTVRHVLSRALTSATFATGVLSTAWASICLFQGWLPRTMLATQRFFLGGFLAGLWAWVERRRGRAIFLYSAKMSVESLWRVGVKRRWWKGVRGGDVLVFMAALVLSGWVHERGGGGEYRKALFWVRGEGWRDWGAEVEAEDEEDAK